MVGVHDGTSRPGGTKDEWMEPRQLGGAQVPAAPDEGVPGRLPWRHHKCGEGRLSFPRGVHWDLSHGDQAHASNHLAG